MRDLLKDGKSRNFLDCPAGAFTIFTGSNIIGIIEVMKAVSKNSLNRPDSGKVTAKGKSVRREIDKEIKTNVIKLLDD